MQTNPQYRQTNYPYSAQNYHPNYQIQTPKHHHYTLLCVVIILAVISTVFIFNFYRQEETGTEINANYQATTPPAFPEENRQNPGNKQLPSDSKSELPPPLPDLP